MTTMLMCVFSFPMLVGYAGLAVLGRAVGTRLRFWGGCEVGGKRQEGQKSLCDSTLPAHQ